MHELDGQPTGERQCEAGKKRQPELASGKAGGRDERHA
jgi:hypothetical protein